MRVVHGEIKDEKPHPRYKLFRDRGCLPLISQCRDMMYEYNLD